MLNKQRDAYAVEDFLADESFVNFHFRLNQNDEESWRRWLEENPHKKAIVKQARELIETLSLSIGEEEYSAELAKIKKAISENTTNTDSYFLKEKKPVRAIPKKRWVSFALFALVGAAGLGYFLFYQPQAVSEQLTEISNNQPAPLRVVLSDSTVVLLASHSTLQYPRRFPKDHRNVYLKGEAQFSVKRNEQAPFKVFSENIVATVLGTVFNFKKAADSSVVVELLKGKLNVQLKDSGSTSIVLYPNEEVVYMKGTHGLLKKMIDVRTNIAFLHNSFDEIAARVKNAFGVTLINKSRKTNWRFTGTFKNATAKEVIDNICFIKDLTAEVKSDTINIK